MKISENQWDELEMDLMDNYFELEARRKFLVVPYALSILPEFKGMGDADKLAFLRLLEHSLDECRTTDDWEQLRIPMTEKVFENMEFTSVMDYQRNILQNAYRNFLLSGNAWIVPLFTTSLFTTPRYTDDKKLEAINYLRAIVAYAGKINKKEINHNSAVLYRTVFPEGEK